MNPPSRYGLLVLFALSRVLLVLCAADRIGQPDPAEIGLMDLGDAWAAEGSASLDQVLRAVRAGPAAPHGGHLVVALLYAALVVPLGVSSYLALKLVVIGFATAGFAAWTAVAERLGGARAAWAAAALLFFCPPSTLSGQLIAWGSHPESAALLGLVAWVVVKPGGGLTRPLVLGLSVGLCVGFNRLTVAAAAVLWLGAVTSAVRPPAGLYWKRVLISAAAAIAVVVAAMALSGGWGASVTEAPGNTPWGLLAHAGEDLVETLRHLFPPRTIPPGSVAGARALEWVLAAIGLAAWAAAMSRQHPRWATVATLAAAGIAHVALVALLAPQRPAIPARYLLPAWPVLAVGIGVGAAEIARRGRWGVAGAACIITMWSLPGALVGGALLDVTRAPRFFAYEPQRYARLDIGKVDYATAPGVNDFLARRSPDIEGFRLAAGTGGGQDLLMRPPPHPVDAAQVLGQVHRWGPSHDRDGGARERTLENLGWGLAVFARDRPGAWRSVLAGLDGLDRTSVAHGIGMGFRAAGLAPDIWTQDPDASALEEGQRRLEAEAAAGRTPPLPSRRDRL